MLGSPCLARHVLLSHTARSRIPWCTLHTHSSHLDPSRVGRAPGAPAIDPRLRAPFAASPHARLAVAQRSACRHHPSLSTSHHCSPCGPAKLALTHARIEHAEGTASIRAPLVPRPMDGPSPHARPPHSVARLPSQDQHPHPAGLTCVHTSRRPPTAQRRPSRQGAAPDRRHGLGLGKGLGRPPQADGTAARVERLHCHRPRSRCRRMPPIAPTAKT